jgi:hypothetical protein
MIQQRNIHRRSGFPELAGELDIRSAGRWIAAGVVVRVITYNASSAIQDGEVWVICDRRI